MKLREYTSSDLREIAELFYGTVHTINAADYTAAQLDAWAPKDRDLSEWDDSFKRRFCVVAVEDGKIVGFGDIDKSGYLDRLYVRAEYVGRGIGSAICQRLECCVRGDIVTHASVTALPFFEKSGYVVVREQRIMRRGVYLKNYVMKKGRT